MISSRGVVAKRSAAVIGSAMLLALVAVALGAYEHVFTSAENITLVATRAGLLLNRGADVRLLGVRVGEVRSVALAPDGTVRIAIAIDTRDAGLISRDAQAQIASTSLFGAKYVLLQQPTGVVADPLPSGATIEADHVAPETDDILAKVRDILLSVDPAELDSTLTAFATALQGQGSALGSYAADLPHYLATINRSDLVPDIPAAARVAGTYAAAAPSLLRIAASASSVSETLDQSALALHSLLIDLAESGTVARQLVGAIGAPLTSLLDLLTPISQTLDQYAGVVPCVLHGLVVAGQDTYDVAGLRKPGIQGLVSLLPGIKGYHYPQDLPHIITKTWASCPQLHATAPLHVPALDDGTHVNTSGAYTVGPGAPPQIYLDLVRQWFGQSGLEALAQAATGR